MVDFTLFAFEINGFWIAFRLNSMIALLYPPSDLIFEILNVQFCFEFNVTSHHITELYRIRQVI